jgi:hypothetical protein
MRYFMNISNGYLTHVGIGEGGISISDEEYKALLEVIRNRPVEPGMGFRLREDLSWERYPMPEISDDLSDSEALEIWLGGGV